MTCSNDGVHVVGLNLSGSELLSSLYPRLSDLSSLQMLDLSINSLSGMIPLELGEL